MYLKPQLVPFQAPMQHISATLLETIDAAQDLVDALEHFSDLV